MNEYAGRVFERFAAHGRCDHADRKVGRALERRTAPEVDNVLAALNHPLLQVGPVAFGHFLTDQRRKGFSGDERRRSEDCHLLTVAAVGTAVTDFIGRNLEVFGQFRTQTRGVQCREGRNLRRLQSCVDQRDETRDVGGIEDHNDVLHVRAISLEVFAELRSDLGIAFQQVLARHAGLAGRTARRYDVSRIGQRLPDVGRPKAQWKSSSATPSSAGP